MNHSLYLVVGLGKTGLSIVRYLHRNNKPFIVFDTRSDAPGLQDLKDQFPDAAVFLEDFPIDQLGQVTDIITSPGLSLDLPLFQHAKKLGIPIYGDIECLAREITAPVVAITGTNGKSTVTTLVGEMAKNSGFKVAVAGNIGTPVLDLLAKPEDFDLWVLELSSFQLDLTYSLKPKAATILNVTMDHLDRHHTMAQYIQAKQRIYNQAEHIIFNREDINTVSHSNNGKDTWAVSFGRDIPNENNWGIVETTDQVYLAQGSTLFIPVDALLIKGVHNWLNAMASCALAQSIGITEEAMRATLKSFSGLAHRCQWVRTLNAVDWINDSKGTNVGATISAINGIGGSMQGKIVLIAGGQGKGADFRDLAKPIADFVRSVVLIGEDADKIEKALDDIVPVSRASSLDNAVLIAKDNAKPGDVVLLSPACASLDMFRDYAHRGDLFVSSVCGL